MDKVSKVCNLPLSLIIHRVRFKHSFVSFASQSLIMLRGGLQASLTLSMKINFSQKDTENQAVKRAIKQGSQVKKKGDN
ncbi:hypothetical protein QL285_038216 [Trifolium repens]|nr:hypothetical protein QL285_038216 [Trifolium repens]